MKNIKKLLSIVMVLAMVLSLGVSAFAEGTITVEKKAGDTYVHSYEIYQIFTGTQKVDGKDNNPLGDLEWGDSIKDKADDFVTALLNVDGFKDKLTSKSHEDHDEDKTITARDVAAFLGANADLADKFADAITPYLKETPFATISSDDTDGETVANGYYMIVDVTEFDDGAFGTAYNKTMLQVTKDVTISPKYDIPTSEKKVLDWNDSDPDDLPITEITAGEINELAWQDSADHDIGDKIFFKLSGKMPSDLKNYDSYTVIFHDKEQTGLEFNKDVKVYVGTTDITDYFSVTTTGLTDGCTFEVSCNDIKQIPAVTDGCEIVVIYSSTLSKTNAVIGPTGNPNEMQMEYTNTSDNDGHGKTKWDKVIVFTYDLDVNKVDGDKKPLEGAEFALYKKVPAGTEGAVALDEDGKETSTGDEIWLPLTIEAKKDAAGNASKTTFYSKGLDDGDYKLVETVTPAGYNTIDPVDFTISAEHDVESDTPALKSVSGTEGFSFTLTPAEGEGMGNTVVVNDNGLELPETGGIGTTIFYVVGAILVAGAVILLVTKKRVNGASK